MLDTDDTGLHRRTHDYLKVLAQFTDDCALCEALAPSVRQLLAEPEFASILFVRLNAARNPVASHLMNQRAAFFCELLPGQYPGVRHLNHAGGGVCAASAPAGLRAPGQLAAGLGRIGPLLL